MKRLNVSEMDRGIYKSAVDMKQSSMEDLRKSIKVADALDLDAPELDTENADQRSTAPREFLIEDADFAYLTKVMDAGENWAGMARKRIVSARDALDAAETVVPKDVSAAEKPGGESKPGSKNESAPTEMPPTKAG